MKGALNAPHTTDPAAKIEALTREVERLQVLASREKGLVESILTVSPYGIIVSDPHGKLTFQNKTAEQIWAGSATAGSVAEWGQYRGFHPDGRPYQGRDWAMARCLESGVTVQPEEMRIIRFDGSAAWLLGGAAPIFNREGRVDGAVSVFADVTRFKKSEEELRLSAQRYLTTLTSIGDAVIATDAHGSISFMNPIAEQLTGWKTAEAAGKPLEQIFKIVNENTREAVESPVAKVIREGKIVGLANHTVLIAKAGHETAIDDSGAPIFDDHGKLAGVVLVFRDVGEKRRDEDRRKFLNQASTLLAASLDYGPTLASVAKLAVPVISDWCAVDILEGGKVTRLAVEHIDPAKIRFVEELERKYPTDPSSPSGAHAVIRTGQSQLITEIPDALLEGLARDAQHLTLLLELGLKSSMVVPLRAHGKTLGAITFVSAESKRKFSAADLAFAEELANCAALAVNNARLYREAQQANRAKDEFLATVSHELRTPLNAILGWSKLLRGSKVPEVKQQQGLETIERNAKAQAQLIEDLLDVSRIISGKLTLELQTIDLVSIIHAAVDSVRLAAESKGVRLTLALDQTAAASTGDSGRLQQVVWNLLSNAVKFTPRGGEVTVALSRNDSQVVLVVSDTGQGIEPDFIPHVFERFRQADAKSTRKHGGLGLGLAIVRHLIELHGGTVTVSSPGAGRGASFEVRLPIAAVQEPSPSESRSEMSAPSLAGLDVVVVDDEEDARVLVREILTGHGASVRTASSAAEALELIAARWPDVIVSDIGMPGEDGYSLMRKVRAMGKDSKRSVPAVALTAYARMEDRARALMAGFQSHVVKPAAPEELLVVVASLAGRTE